MLSRITTGCSHLHCLHEKSSLDKNRYFSLVKVVLEEIPSEKFTLEPVEQSAITITTIKRRKANISPITKGGGKRKYPRKLREKNPKQSHKTGETKKKRLLEEKSQRRCSRSHRHMVTKNLFFFFSLTADLILCVKLATWCRVPLMCFHKK